MGRPPSTLRIGNGAGFWGDNLDAPFLLARDGALDVLTLEYLAELSLAILSHLRVRDPAAGYVTDFPELLSRLVPLLKEQPTLRIVTNAGGLNARSCVANCSHRLAEAGLGAAKFAIVEGDDILSSLSELRNQGINFNHIETGQPIDQIFERLVCANVYLGARSIAESLIESARIVVTGRVADASLTLGPAVAEFGWGWDDWGRLAGASVAGHLIECGAQATGGLWHAWEEIPDLVGIGYPIAEIEADGSSTITKPLSTGGLVNVGTVSEQLVYEIDDPACYRTPDVDVELTSVELAQVGTDRVKVTGATGKMPSDHLKVSAVYRDGWTASGMLVVAGAKAEAKARAAGQIVLERVKSAGFTLTDSLVECLGAGDVVPGVLQSTSKPFEVVLRITVRDANRAAVERFCRELAPLVTSGPSGIAGYASARPTPRPAFGYWPTLIPREFVKERFTVQTAEAWVASEGNGIR